MPPRRSGTPSTLRSTPSGWGYRRFWLAEHHGMPGIASAATAVVIAHVAAGTATIRVGSGGIMLPNHAPLMVAEAVRHAGGAPSRAGSISASAAPPAPTWRRRGRSAATLPPTSTPSRRTSSSCCTISGPQGEGARVRAIPGEGADVEVWMLGSSLFGAELAATLGLPYAFASHFAPGQMEEAIEVYRTTFRPSERWPKSHLMLALNVFAADTDQEARRLFTSLQQAFVNLRTGRPGKLPPPVDDFGKGLDDRILFTLDQALACTVVGTPETVPARHRRLRRPDRGGRADAHRADLRPRRPPPLVRDRRRGDGAYPSP